MRTKEKGGDEDEDTWSGLVQRQVSVCYCEEPPGVLTRSTGESPGPGLSVVWGNPSVSLITVFLL